MGSNGPTVRSWLMLGPYRRKPVLIDMSARGRADMVERRSRQLTYVESRPSVRSLDFGQAFLQAIKLRTNLQNHCVFQCGGAPAEKFGGGLSVQILLPIPDCHLGRLLRL